MGSALEDRGVVVDVEHFDNHARLVEQRRVARVVYIGCKQKSKTKTRHFVVSKQINC